MGSEDEFYRQLAISIQSWLWVETEIYLLYAAIMDGANPHLVSVTFHNTESFDSKLGLINSCLALIFPKDSTEWKSWKSLFNKARKLNGKRNKIVHEPVKTGVLDGVETIAISPSFFNAQALVKGQTTYNGPVIGSKYKAILATITEDHKIELVKLYEIEKSFKAFAKDIQCYREGIRAALQSAHESARSDDIETTPPNGRVA